MNDKKLITWLLLGACLLGACVVAPPEVEIFTVDGAEVEWPTPTNTPIGTHQLGDTVEIRIKAKDNRSLATLELFSLRRDTNSFRPYRASLFLAQFSLKPTERATDLRVRIVMRKDSIENRSYTGFSEDEPNWVEGIYDLRTDTLQEIELEIWDYQNRITNETYRFVVES
jgi:hypothetical protein